MNVERKEHCSICLETAFTAEEFCMKSLAVVAAAEVQRDQIYSKDTHSKIALLRYVSILNKLDLHVQFSTTTEL